MSTLSVPLVEQEEAGVRLQGCYPDMTNAEYHSSKALSGSNTKYILEAPALYKYRQENPEDQTPAMREGSALHALVLEPERGLVPVVPENLTVPPQPERPANANGKAKAGTPEKEAFLAYKTTLKAWEAKRDGIQAKHLQWEQSLSPDVIRISPARREVIQGAADALLANPDVIKHDLFRGVKECSWFHTCKESGAYVRIKLDCWDEESGVIVDVKKAVSASARRFSKQAGDLGYFRSAAMQWDVLEQMGHKVNAYVFAVVEPEAPHLTQLFEYDEPDLEQGRREWKEAARIWAQCTESGDWPGLPGGVSMLTIPPYLRDLDYMA